MNSILKSYNFNYKLLFILYFSTFNYISVIGQNINFEWALNIGGQGDEYGRGITSDSDGNSYLIGFFSETVDFDFSTTSDIH